MTLSTETTSTVAASTATPSELKQQIVLLTYLESGVAVITLGSSEEKVISLTMERMVSLERALKELETNKPKGLIITGTSAEMFTVGADIKLISSVTAASHGEELALTGQRVY